MKKINIKYDGTLWPFNNIKNTKELRDKLNLLGEVESSNISHMANDSIDTATITIISLNVVSIGLQIAQLIHSIIAESNRKDRPIEIKVDQKTIIINSNESIEEIRNKLNCE